MIENFLLRLSFILALAGHGADLASTEYCIGKGSCREMNKWLARFDSPVTFGAAKMGVAGGGELLVYEMSKDHKRLAITVNFGIAGAFFAVAAHNARVGK